jgi:hypothetical protein
VAPSAPEVKLSYAAAGRDTLAAIDAELSRPARTAEAPVLEISEAPAGRETMAAIAEELADAARPRQDTLPYGDRISNAPGAPTPLRPPASPTSPELRPDTLEIFELLTFIVRGNQVGDLSTDGQRRRFVEAHLLGRVPGGTMEGVERVEVTPWTAKGTMVVRVWCRTLPVVSR